MRRLAHLTFALLVASCGASPGSRTSDLAVDSGADVAVVFPDVIADPGDGRGDADVSDVHPGDAGPEDGENLPSDEGPDGLPDGLDDAGLDLPGDSEDAVAEDDADGSDAAEPADGGADVDADTDSGDVTSDTAPPNDLGADALPVDAPAEATDVAADATADLSDLPPEPEDAPVDGALSDGSSEAGDVPGERLVVTLMAANLTSGNYQSYDPGHGIRLMAGARADVYLVQEFNFGLNLPDDYRAMADAVCGPDCDYSVGVGEIPNGVISRWPIVESGAWDDPTLSNRDLDWARIDLPGERDLFVVSVHLHTDPASDQVKAAQVVAARVAEHRAAHPGCCWYAVGGDFNGTTAVSAKGFGAWNGEPVFCVEGPHPVGEDGSVGTNASRSKQYDYVLLDTELRTWQVPLEVDAADGGDPLVYPDGLVFDSRDFEPAELGRYFWPALQGDSGASSMQHMGVIKAVRLP